MQSIDELWTHRQTAAFLRITPGTLYVWNSKGVGPRSYKVGGMRKYDPVDVREFIQQGGMLTTFSPMVQKSESTR